MSSLCPPKGYKRGFSDEACRDMAQRALASELGQRALREGWGVGLYQYVMDWASTPTRPETLDALQRAANEFMWDVMELRKLKMPDPLTAANLSLAEARVAQEADFQRRFLKDQKGSETGAETPDDEL